MAFLGSCGRHRIVGKKRAKRNDTSRLEIPFLLKNPPDLRTRVPYFRISPHDPQTQHQPPFLLPPMICSPRVSTWSTQSDQRAIPLWLATCARPARPSVLPSHVFFYQPYPYRREPSANKGLNSTCDFDAQKGTCRLHLLASSFKPDRLNAVS